MAESTENLDELLEQLWVAREEGPLNQAHFASPIDGQLTDGFGQLVVFRLADLKGGDIVLTEEGERVARDIVRRHRLAERLLSDVLELPEAQSEAGACRFEHILSPEVTESLCAFLGHPRSCPHGKPIPPGECCTAFTTEVKPLVTRLSDLRPGEEGVIVFISAKHRSRLERLGAFGIMPGGKVTLHQKRPSHIIQVGETEVALDRDIVSEIYVRKMDPSAEARWRREAKT